MEFNGKNFSCVEKGENFVWRKEREMFKLGSREREREVSHIPVSEQEKRTEI